MHVIMENIIAHNYFYTIPKREVLKTQLFDHTQFYNGKYYKHTTDNFSIYEDLGYAYNVCLCCVRVYSRVFYVSKLKQNTNHTMRLHVKDIYSYDNTGT